MDELQSNINFDFLIHPDKSYAMYLSLVKAMLLDQVDNTIKIIKHKGYDILDMLEYLFNTKGLKIYITGIHLSREIEIINRVASYTTIEKIKQRYGHTDNFKIWFNSAKGTRAIATRGVKYK